MISFDSRYTEAYGPHEFMLNIDGITIYTKTMITCDDGQIFVGPEEHKVRSIGHYAIFEEVTMHLEIEPDLSAHVMDIHGKKTPLKGLIDTGAVLSVTPTE